MIATLDFVKDRFSGFNAMIFGGTLKPLSIRLSSARTSLGQLRYTKTRKMLGGYKYSNFTLCISDKLDLDERVLEDTIIHEMIHYYILSNQLVDTSSHGKIFRKMMSEINERFGRNISISHRRTDDEKENDTELRRHLVCVSRFYDGRVGVTVVAESRIFRLWDEIPRFEGVKECRWYFTTNPYFNRFRRSISVKIYLITDTEELEMGLIDALALKKSGRTIIPE